MNPKEILERYAVDPRKSLGQNFLHDPNAVEKIVTTAELMPEDTALEIGPGTGMLTEALARAAARVVAVELDQRLAPILAERLAPYPNVELVFQDFLETDVSALIGDHDFTVVANVPYYITSAILRHLFDAPRRPRRIVLTVQLEVAERLVAKPDDMSLLAVSAQFYAKAKIATRFNRAVFWPRPDVDSAVVKLDLYDPLPYDVPDEATFFRVARAGFSMKRKQLKNTLSAGLSLSAADATRLLETAGVDPRRRAETLTLEEWAALARASAAL